MENKTKNRISERADPNIRRLWELEKPNEDLFTRIRWDHLRFSCSSNELFNLALNENALSSYRQMARQVIEIMYKGVFENG